MRISTGSPRIFLKGNAVTDVVVHANPLLATMVFSKWKLPRADDLSSYTRGHFVRATVVGETNVEIFLIGPLEERVVDSHAKLIMQLDNAVSGRYVNNAERHS